MHDRLVERLAPIPVEIMLHESDPPDPWENYRRCLDYRGDASHLLVVQDDAIPADGFAEAAWKIADRNPGTPICLFLGAAPAATAALARRAKPDVRYVPLGPSSFMPLVSVLWPTHVAKAFLNWTVGQRRLTRADDGNAAKWIRATKQQVLVAVPSIVQHDDGEPTVKGGRKHKPWAEAWRQAVLLADDATRYNW